MSFAIGFRLTIESVVRNVGFQDILINAFGNESLNKNIAGSQSVAEPFSSTTTKIMFFFDKMKDEGGLRGLTS